MVQTRAGTLQETITFTPGLYYTVAAIGLVIPEELNAQDEGGFFDFFNDLFSSGDDRSELALRLVSYEDNVFSNPGPGGLMTPRTLPTQANRNTATGGNSAPDNAGIQVQDLVYLRLVRAAPGTAPVTLELAEPQAGDENAQIIVSDVAFAEVSGLNTVTPVQASDLEVSLQGTAAGALTLSLGDTPLEPGRLNTLFVIGTPTDEAPLEVLTVNSPLPTLGAPGSMSGGTMSGGAVSGGATSGGVMSGGSIRP